MRLAIRQRSPEWIEWHRTHITGTAIPIILGLSPFASEADLAAQMRGEYEVESTLPMRKGTALEDFIAAEYAAETGRKVRRVKGVFEADDNRWAGASPDFETAGRLVECKNTDSRNRFADGLPQDIEAQTTWQLYASGREVCDVAALVAGADRVQVFTVERNDALIADLVAVAQDFRARLAAGGPFAQSPESIKRRYPSDNGAELLADGTLIRLVERLADARRKAKDAESEAEAVEVAVKERMADFAVLRGPNFRITWKKAKDGSRTDWKALAADLNPPAEVVAAHTVITPGARRFLLTLED